MEFKLPKLYDIGFESDHIRLDGSWFVILSDMVVNYRGFTSFVSEPALGNDEIAIRLIRALSEQYYAFVEPLAAEIPSHSWTQPTNMCAPPRKICPGKVRPGAHRPDLLGSKLNRRGEASWVVRLGNR